MKVSINLIAVLCTALVAACAIDADGTAAGNTEINLDIVNPGGTSGELGFSIDRVDYRITCAGGGYVLPPYAHGPAGENGDPCSLDDLDTNGIPDVCPPGSNYIAGTAGPDNIVGTNGPDCIFGMAGNDVIDGVNGKDHICGGAGNDQISSSNSDDLLVGGDGDDVLDGGNGNDSLDGGPGIDTLDGASGSDICVEEVPGTSIRLTACEQQYSDAVDISGAFEVVDTRVPPSWQAVMDLPPGDCAITLSVYEDDEIVCVGSQTLAINEDATTKYDIVLVCSLSVDLPGGMADVDGTFEFITGNLCPKLYVLNAIEVDVCTNPQTGVITKELQYRAKDPDNTCGNNCDPQTCDFNNPPICTPYPSNINDPACNSAWGGNPNSAECLAGDYAGLVCTISAVPSVTPGVPGGTFINPADGVTPVGPVLPVNLNLVSGIPGIILPGMGGPAGTNAANSPAYPPLPNPNGSLPPLYYQCDLALPGSVVINVTCSDGDAECDQNKQTTVVCGTCDFCISDPVDCSASSECLTDGVCDNGCDPVDAGNGLCDRCAGKDNPVADGTPCTGGVCSSGTCALCPFLTQVVVIPLQANVGDDIDVAAAASGTGTIDYLWTATAGSFADPTAPVTTYRCEEAGQQDLTITVSDGTGLCTDAFTVTVTCLG
ncbi:MAG: calcium-binding protein [Myxococcales bacterium]|nr:MAG: calcium-binding protein [Myxococcales bacterium]